MRDRLIELIDKAGGVATHHFFDDIKLCPNPVERIADHLLSNGVIVPPCKVGDIVYAKFSATDEIEYYVIDKVSHNGSNYFSFEAHLENEDGYVVDILEFDLVDIGITVFLTREEAEQAMEEVLENDR